MRCLACILWGVLVATGCPAGDDGPGAPDGWWDDAPPSDDAGPDLAADDANPDGPPGDGRPEDSPPPPDDGGVDGFDAADDGAVPPEPFCRYECRDDGTCDAVFGGGYVCREATVTVERFCQRGCSGDADCRFGGPSDPLMVCRAGVCTQRACAAAAECAWVGAGAVCREVTWGSVRSCFRPCAIDADCRYGTPADLLMRCRSGICVSGCDTDTDCRTAFGVDGYLCRPPPAASPGPSCVRACAAAADCFLGAPSDVMAVCR